MKKESQSVLFDFYSNLVCFLGDLNGTCNFTCTTTINNSIVTNKIAYNTKCIM